MNGYIRLSLKSFEEEISGLGVPPSVACLEVRPIRVGARGEVVEPECEDLLLLLPAQLLDHLPQHRHHLCLIAAAEDGRIRAIARMAQQWQP